MHASYLEFHIPFKVSNKNFLVVLFIQDFNEILVLLFAFMRILSTETVLINEQFQFRNNNYN